MSQRREDPLDDFDQTNGQVDGLEGRPVDSAAREKANGRVRFINQILGAFGRWN